MIGGLVRVADLPAPPGFPDHRWAGAKATALSFAKEWLNQACRLGWTPLELFGLHPLAPDARLDVKGLAWQLERGARVVAMTAQTAAIIMPSGSRLTFYRRPNRGRSEAVLPWEIAPTRTISC